MPLAAGLAYLKDALWEAHDLETCIDLTGQSWPVDVRDPDFYWRFAERFQFCKDLLGWHIASHRLEQGGDLFVAKKHSKQLAKEKGSDLPLLDLMLQRGLYHGSQTGFEPCPLCSARRLVPQTLAVPSDVTSCGGCAARLFLGAKSALAHSTFKVLASGPN